MTEVGRAERELRDLDLVFKALAHHTRRHILVVLAARGGKMTAGAIAGRFACKWPTTSRHLQQLQSAGLVISHKQGREHYYQLNRARLAEVAGGWLTWIETLSTGKHLNEE